MLILDLVFYNAAVILLGSYCIVLKSSFCRLNNEIRSVFGFASVGFIKIVLICWQHFLCHDTLTNDVLHVEPFRVPQGFIGNNFVRCTTLFLIPTSVSMIQHVYT